MPVTPPEGTRGPNTASASTTSGYGDFWMTTVELSRPGSCVEAASTNTTARGSAVQARDKQPWQLIAGRGACDARARPKCAGTAKIHVCLARYWHAASAKISKLHFFKTGHRCEVAERVSRERVVHLINRGNRLLGLGANLRRTERLPLRAEILAGAGVSRAHFERARVTRRFQSRPRDVRSVSTPGRRSSRRCSSPGTRARRGEDHLRQAPVAAGERVEPPEEREEYAELHSAAMKLYSEYVENSGVQKPCTYC